MYHAPSQVVRGKAAAVPRSDSASSMVVMNTVPPGGGPGVPAHSAAAATSQAQPQQQPQLQGGQEQEGGAAGLQLLASPTRGVQPAVVQRALQPHAMLQVHPRLGAEAPGGAGAGAAAAGGGQAVGQQRHHRLASQEGAFEGHRSPLHAAGPGLLSPGQQQEAGQGSSGYAQGGSGAASPDPQPSPVRRLVPQTSQNQGHGAGGQPGGAQPPGARRPPRPPKMPRSRSTPLPANLWFGDYYGEGGEEGDSTDCSTIASRDSQQEPGQHGTDSKAPQGAGQQQQAQYAPVPMPAHAESSPAAVNMPSPGTSVGTPASSTSGATPVHPRSVGFYSPFSGFNTPFDAPEVPTPSTAFAAASASSGGGGPEWGSGAGLQGPLSPDAVSPDGGLAGVGRGGRGRASSFLGLEEHEAASLPYGLHRITELQEEAGVDSGSASQPGSFSSAGAPGLHHEVLHALQGAAAAAGSGPEGGIGGGDAAAAAAAAEEAGAGHAPVQTYKLGGLSAASPFSAFSLQHPEVGSEGAEGQGAGIAQAGDSMQVQDLQGPDSRVGSDVRVQVEDVAEAGTPLDSPAPRPAKAAGQGGSPFYSPFALASYQSEQGEGEEGEGAGTEGGGQAGCPGDQEAASQSEGAPVSSMGASTAALIDKAVEEEEEEERTVHPQVAWIKV